MIGTSTLKTTKEPMLREISFEGNMPSTYEKDLRKKFAKEKSRKPFK